MVSNPHSLGFEAHITEFGNTFDGNYKYKLVCVCGRVRGLYQDPITLFVLFYVNETRCPSVGQGSHGICYPTLAS